MEKAKRKRLEEKGWRVMTVAEFLELTPAESEIIELRLSQQSTEAKAARIKYDAGSLR